MLGFLLAIDESDVVLEAETDQCGQCDLGRIRLSGEHRLAENRATDSDAVKPTGQFPVDPRLDTVRKTGAVKRAIGL